MQVSARFVGDNRSIDLEKIIKSIQNHSKRNALPWAWAYERSNMNEDPNSMIHTFFVAQMKNPQKGLDIYSEGRLKIPEYGKNVNGRYQKEEERIIQNWNQNQNQKQMLWKSSAKSVVKTYFGLIF